LDSLTCRPYVGKISGQEVRCDIVKYALALYLYIFFIQHIIIFEVGYYRPHFWT